ncbi:MAG TPA: ABC transporter substrate-binding protein [Baekduia sp.]|uniref:substrate-binding periplasmic protein n=1 Tax=Baekduia sp. TaxID=2600305 RepID=UPI002C56B74D|nr:ABC transporter substrate-binding protein [Baekduia sp.]HMJ37826.1 ABC transporter substrate-binding protein [Baekduia sp.]
MTSSEARRQGRGRSAARLAVVLSAVAILTAMPAACGGDGGGARAASGNAATGTFHPPRIQTNVDAGVRKACDVRSATIDRIKREGVLFWAIGVSPPFGFELERGVWAGVEAQNAAELANILGVDFDIAEYSYDVLPQALVTGQADIVGAELFVTDERKKLIDFSVPYYQSGQLFYVLEDSPYQTIDDLNNPAVRFVYGTGTAQLDLAKKYVPKAKISDTPLGNRLLLHDVLADDRADATMSQAAAMKVIREKFRRPPLAAIGRNGRVTGQRASSEDVLDPFDVAFGLPKGDEAWRGCVNAWVRDLRDSGRMAKRIDYWLAQPVT